MAKLAVLRLRLKLPWWWRIYVGCAATSAAVAAFVGLPVTREHIEALGERLGQTIARHTKITVE